MGSGMKFFLNIIFTGVFVSFFLMSCSDSIDKVTVSNSDAEVHSVGASLVIDASICYGCAPQSCYVRCPSKAVSKREIGNRTVYLIDPEMCTKCGICIKVCPFDAITWKQ
jgi:Fe-S-cluster-containing hydrogenase component 2